MKRSGMLQGLAVAGCLMGVTVHAGQADGETPEDALLEFLGEWESVEGEWIDPLALEELSAESKLAENGVTEADEERRDDEDEI